MKYKLIDPEHRHTTKIDYKKELNPEQVEVLKDPHGPILVLAGAGSGKTRTLVYLTSYLLEHGVVPEHIMLVTFTNKVAREMLSRVELLLQYHPKGLWGGTFHHLANRILRKYAKAIGYDNNFSILDSDDAKSLLKSCIGEMRIDTKQELFPKPEVIHGIISFHQNSLIPIPQIIEKKYSYIKEKFIPTIERIHTFYFEKKKKSNAMDFDDLLTNWWRLLKEHEEIKKSLAAQFHFILVDEYQDTNTVQAEIVEMLASVHHNVVVVGDDSQSIYSFRAADINNILRFPEKFAETKVFKLETNYRSTPEILAVANHSIKHNQQQFSKKLKSVKNSFSKPGLVPLSDSYQQADFICQRIFELQEQGAELSSIAVLFRSAFQVIELELELNKRGIPYEMRGGIRFFEQAHIKDVVAYLKVFHNPKDELSWKRLLQLYPGIGPAAAQRYWEEIQHCLNLEAVLSAPISVSPRSDIGFASVKKIFEHLMAITDRFVPEAIELILRSGYKKYLETTFENAKDRIEDLEQLANFSVTYTKLDDFLSEVTLSEAFRSDQSKDNDEPKDALILSTIHQAKGLEWKTVFVIGLADGQFPHRKIYDKPDELEEERRLFYVAVTRAQDELYLTYPVISNSYMTGQSINRPSMFLKEIDEGLFEKWEVEGEYRLPTISYDDGDEAPGILKRIRGL